MSAATVSAGREIAAFGAMAAAGSIIGGSAVQHWGSERGFHWALLAVAIATAVSGFGLTRRSLVAQVVARGYAWLLALPLAIVTIAAAARGNQLVELGALAVLSGAALLLARPGLHSTEAHEAFSPHAFRRTLLAGATASASVGITVGTVAILNGWRGLEVASLLGAGGLALVASAIGVVRMRAWGVLLGTFTSFAFLGAAALRPEFALSLALAAAPPLLLHLLPILVARSRNEGPRLRVADDVGAPVAAPLRIAIDEEPVLDGAPAKALVARH